MKTYHILSAWLGCCGALMALPTLATASDLSTLDAASGSPLTSQPHQISQGLFSSQIATLQAIELSEDGSQLILRTDRAVGQVNSGWQQRVTSHRIELSNTQLAPQVMLPDLTDHPGLVSMRVEQADSTTVVVQLELVARVQVGTLRQLDSQRLAVPLGGTSTSTPMTSEAIAARIADITLPNVAHLRPLIVIDPGHGGSDPGAVGIGGLREKDIVFPVAQRVATLLEQQGAQVVLTRQDDRTLDLSPRVQTAQRYGADMFISLHANAISMSRPDVNGVETYYYSSSDRPVAEAIQRSLLQATGMRDRGAKSARFYVLVNTSMPSALVEMGFVTGAEDAALLADPEFRELIAYAIAHGILDYAQANP